MTESTTRHGTSGGRRFKFGRHNLPGGIALQVTLLVLFCLLILEFIGWVTGIGREEDQSRDQLEYAVARQVVEIVDFWERTTPEARPQLVKSLNSPFFRVAVFDSPPAMENLPPWVQEEVDKELPEIRKIMGRRDIEIGFVSGRRNELFRDEAFSQEIPVPWRFWITFSVAASDGKYLFFALPPDDDLWNRDSGHSFWGVFTWLLIILFVFAMARRLTRPLRQFADASDRLGVDVDAPPLPEKGSRELKRATHAFNQMQERLKRLIDDRTQMLAAISHDLKTMLTRLRLRAEYIEDAEQQGKAFADLSEMEQMLEATLSFARDDSAEEERTRLDLVALLESLCADFVDLGNEVTYFGPDKLIYEGRPIGLKRAFTNLIENGINYGEKVAVRVETKETIIHICFEDQGPGIPDHLRENVFAPFYRIEGSRNRETGGTGLGLSVARTIIRRHGGDILLEDGPGGGLRARVTLPAV